MEDIIDELKALGLEINQSKETQTDKWLETTAKLYEKLMVAQYLASRKANLEALENSVKQNLEAVVTATPISVKPDAKPEPIQTLPGNDEIRVVPHPEGPPVTKAGESLYEKKEVVSDKKLLDVEEETAEPFKPKGGKTDKTIKSSVADKAAETKKKSLNEKLSGKALKIGLNDRIAFVKHLFNGSLEDYQRVVSQLNSFKTLDDAKNFIEHLVKPEYSWKDKEDYEERFNDLLEKRFG